MHAQLVWLVSSCYWTPDDLDIVLDMTRHVRSLLTNKVWKRDFSYAFLDPPKCLDGASVVSARATIMANPPSNKPHVVTLAEVRKILATHCGCNPPGNGMLNEGGMHRARNVTLIDVTLDFDVPVVPWSDGSARFASEDSERIKYDMICLAEEVGALLRAAIHLTFSGYATVREQAPRHLQGGSLMCLKCPGQSEFWPRLVSDFTYHAVFTAPQMEDFRNRLDALADVWHLPLWPIHRYLKAHSGEVVEMDSLLDILFALEGLFDRTSPDFIKLACSLLLSSTRNEAVEVHDVLRQAFKMRNEIVHGGKHYTGYEEVNLKGSPEHSCELLGRVRTVVSKMIDVALHSLRARPQMHYLHIDWQNVMENVRK
jgi:hypothetical protein